MHDMISVECNLKVTFGSIDVNRGDILCYVITQIRQTIPISVSHL